MGMIQSSVNSALGTIAGAMGVSKVLKGQKEANEVAREAKEIAKATQESAENSEYIKLLGDIPSEEEHINAVQDKLNEDRTKYEKDYENYYKKGNIEEKKNKPKGIDLTKRELALKRMQGVIDSETLQVNEWKKRLEYLESKRGGNK